MTITHENFVLISTCLPTDWSPLPSGSPEKVKQKPYDPGYFGASTGGGAVLVAAAELAGKVGAVVSRGGRPDLAGEALRHVKAPTLFIVGGFDGPVIQMNEEAYAQLQCVKEFKIIPGATHQFEEPGKLEEVANLASKWFVKPLQ